MTECQTLSKSMPVITNHKHTLSGVKGKGQVGKQSQYDWCTVTLKYTIYQEKSM